MKSSALTPVFLFSLVTLTACGGGSKSPDPTPTKDTVAPVITLNGENSLTHSAGTAYADLGATATDAVDGTISVTMSGAVDSDVVSSYTLTYTATDTAGNASNLTRTVDVQDLTGPVITPTGSKSIKHNVGDAYTDLGATGTDNIDETVTIITSGEVNGAEMGSYTITYTATDEAGNETSTARIVTVEDLAGPVITPTGGDSITHNVNHNLGDVYTEVGATGVDNGDETVTIITSGEVNVNVIGSYVITYTATDALEHTTSQTRTVNVQDLAGPVITLTGGDSITHSVNHNYGDPYTDQGAMGLDNADETVTIITTGEVDFSVMGTYTITYTATDAAGNETSIDRTVIVADFEAPVITLNGNAEITLSDSQTYTEQNATALDNVTDNVVVTITGEVLATPATYTITYTALDEADNEATATRTVIVEDDIVPEVFTFTAKIDVFLNTVVESDALTITGLNVAAAVSITNGEFSINGAAYTADVSTITSGQNIKVRTTSGTALDELKQASLTIGGITSEFDITTRTAEPSGLFAGTGSVNGGTNNLVDVKAIIYNEHFMLFDEAENVLYDGNIQTYTGDTFTALVDIYKDGLFVKQESATGTVVNQGSIALALNGTGYGVGTIDVNYDALYTRGATEARFLAQNLQAWGGLTNTVNKGVIIGISSPATGNTFSGGPVGAIRCNYNNGIKTIPDNTVNIYKLSFDAEENVNCGHLGTDYQGFATIIDNGAFRFTDGVMWFAAANGVNSTFTVLDYQ